MTEEIVIITPQPYDVVETKFWVWGKVPKSWLAYGRYGLGVDWRTTDYGYLPMSGPRADVFPGLFFKFKKKIRFQSYVDLSYFDASEHPRGLILEISGEKDHMFLLPVIIAGTNKLYDSEHENLKEKLSSTIKKVTRCRREYEMYLRDLEELRKKKVDNPEILESIFTILEESGDQFETITISDEEKQEKALEEKYKDAIEWRGPLFRGVAGKMEGFDMTVHSNDHGKHFHVIHKGKGIDARFSFPEMELLNYLSETKISAKTQKKIKDFCNKPDIFARLENEFAKR